MNSKERMMRVLSGERGANPPAVFHAWGDYKVEFAGFNPKFQYCQGGPELAGIETTFYERFQPDWIHCGSAAGPLTWKRERRVDGKRAFLRSEDGQRWLYAEIRKAGLLPLGYWLGDVRPHMHWLNSLNMAGLLIEEDKKGFALDPLEIRRMLRPETCLFGNLDSNLLLWGTPEAIRTEVRRQRRAAAEGAFVVANGSPLVLGTPAANLDAYMEEARK
jgi:hypothetical protein